jgi:hypothetical protein
LGRQVGRAELPQDAGGLFEVEAVAFLLAHGAESVESAHRSLELPSLGRKRRTGRGIDSGAGVKVNGNGVAAGSRRNQEFAFVVATL